MADPVQDLDVLIVGAGISGIGAAVHLQQQCPGKTWAILESQDGFGGTWRTHPLPGLPPFFWWGKKGLSYQKKG